MKRTRRTYALPLGTALEFEQAMRSGERSAVVARIIQDWLKDQARERLRAEIAEGCREMWGEYLEIERKWHSADEALWHAYPY